MKKFIELVRCLFSHRRHLKMINRSFDGIECYKCQKCGAIFY